MPHIFLQTVIGLTFVLLFLEGVGNVFVHTYFVFFSAPLLIAAILLILRKKNTISLPVMTVFGWLLLLTAVCLSTFGFSMLKHESLYLSFLFFHYCAFFILGNTYKHELTTQIPWFIVAWAFANTVFMGYANVINVDMRNAYQFVYPTFGSHNHSGELAGVALLTLIFLPSPIALRALGGLLLLIVVLLSFSRSAYIWLIIVYISVLFLYRLKLKRIHIVTAIVAVFGIVLWLTATIRPLPIPQLTPVQKTLTDVFQLVPRGIISGRDMYFTQSIHAIFNNPLWGSGIGSFTFATRRFSSGFSLQTDHAHNVFLEVGVELGIIGLIGLLGILAPILWNIVKNKPTIQVTAPFLMLVFTFLTDYIYAINGVLLLFFLLGGLLTASKQPKASSVLVAITVVFAIIQIIWIDMVIASIVALGFNQPELAIKLYPLSVSAYQKALNTLPYETAQKYVDSYLYASPNTAAYIDVAQFYAKNKNPKEAVLYYEKAVLSNPSLDLAYVIDYARLLQDVKATRRMNLLKKTFVDTYNYYEVYEIPTDSYPNILKACELLAPSCNSIHWYSQIQKPEE